MRDELLKDLHDKIDQFLFLVYYTNPVKDRYQVIVDDGSIKFHINSERFLYLFNELLQPRTMEIERNFQRIKASLSSYGKWYFYDRNKNIFKELLELPNKEHISPSELFKDQANFASEILSEKFVAIQKQYDKEVIQKNPLPKQSNKLINKFYHFFRNINK